ATTGHGATSPVGGTLDYRQWASQAIIVPTREARPRLLILRLLIHVLVMSPSATEKWKSEA
ncbi:hypothetical protein AVEN_125542-1, partial [Araneus ventricosus]